MKHRTIRRHSVSSILNNITKCALSESGKSELHGHAMMAARFSMPSRLALIPLEVKIHLSYRSG